MFWILEIIIRGLELNWLFGEREGKGKREGNINEQSDRIFK
jgi:hypothetical protein